MSLLPRASKTWPDLSDPSGNVRETISLYFGNFTYVEHQHSLSDLFVHAKISSYIFYYD
jgi:hypothetical protein